MEYEIPMLIVVDMEVSKTVVGDALVFNTASYTLLAETASCRHYRSHAEKPSVRPYSF